MRMDRGQTSFRWVKAAIAFGFFLWLAHALAYLVHEYSHSFMAWSFGYKATPFALDYGSLSLNNVLTLGDIDENC